jgi:hypothetical protein
MMAKTSVIKSSKELEAWKKVAPQTSEYFSGDEVIDAYYKGKDDGIAQSQKALIELFKGNIVKAGANTRTVVEFLNTNGFKFHAASLKAISFDELQVIITVDEKDILNDEFLKVYDFTAHLEAEVRQDLYFITFVFAHSQNLNSELLKSDGFVFEYKTK